MEYIIERNRQSLRNMILIKNLLKAIYEYIIYILIIIIIYLHIINTINTKQFNLISQSHIIEIFI